MAFTIGIDGEVKHKKKTARPLPLPENAEEQRQEASDTFRDYLQRASTGVSPQQGKSRGTAAEPPKDSMQNGKAPASAGSSRFMAGASEGRRRGDDLRSFAIV